MKIPVDKPSTRLKSEESDRIRMQIEEFEKNNKIEIVPSRLIKTDYSFRDWRIKYDTDS